MTIQEGTKKIFQSLKDRISDTNSCDDKKASHMKLSTTVFIGYRNLKIGKTRSMLTIGGVAVGIAIITFLICIGFGVQRVIVNEVTKNNSVDVLDVSNANLESFVMINDSTVERLRGMSGVKEVQPLMNGGGQAYYANSQTDVVIYGANKEYFPLANIKLLSGSLEDYKGGERNVIISSRLAGLLGFSNVGEAIGKEMEFTLALSRDISEAVAKSGEERKDSAIITGILDDNQNTFLYMPFETCKKDLGVTAAQSAKLRIDANDIGNIRSAVEQMGLVTESVVDLVDQINSFFVVIRIIMIVLGTIIMSISAMGMLNTLSVSLLQRTREVGILKALGAKRKDIFFMFVFEAAIISFLGGLVGFVIGYGGAVLINFIFNIFASRQGLSAINFVYIPPAFLLAISLFILFLGMITGLMPARRAALIHALDALRYE